MEQIRETLVGVIENLKEKAQNMPTSPQSSEQNHEIQKPQNRFKEATWEKIDPEIWEKIISSLNEGIGLYVFGKVGTGKTYLCHALKKIWDKNHGIASRSKIIGIPELFLRIKSTFNNHDPCSETQKQIIDELSIGDWPEYKNLLILDDLGTEKPTEWAQETLFLIIDRRYQQNRQTIFTSNLSLDDLSERLGDRITSRIAEMCKIIELKGKDRRIK